MLSKYIISNIDGKSYCRSNGHFTKHLKNNNITYQAYYEKYITYIKEVCQFCGNPKQFYQKNHTYADTCGNKRCVGKRISKVKAAFTKEKYIKQRKAFNVTMSKKSKTELKDIRRRSRQTMLRVDDNGLSGYDKQQIKSEKTKLIRYNDSKYNNSSKISSSKQNRTTEQNNITNDKRRKTMFEIYGVENNFLKPEVISKARRAKIKDYITPSGELILVRGYEPFALDVLYNIYDDSDVIMNDVIGNNNKIIKLKYIAVNRHILNYYPDIYIPSKNLIIEVKSQWWYDGYGKEKYKSRLENNHRKQRACLNMGYNYEFWIWNPHIKEFDIKQ